MCELFVEQFFIKIIIKMMENEEISVQEHLDNVLEYYILGNIIKI